MYMLHVKWFHSVCLGKTFPVDQYFLEDAVEFTRYNMSLDARKTIFRVSDQVPHKPCCTSTEDGQELKISNLERREIVLSK